MEHPTDLADTRDSTSKIVATVIVLALIAGVAIYIVYGSGLW